jgi:hypothetical protein
LIGDKISRHNPPSNVLAGSRRRYARSTWFLTFILVSLATTGCGPRMATVRGKVSREGQAVSGGKVNFSPIGEGQPAAGLIQPDGTFQLSTHQENDGAKLGSYRITVLDEHASGEESLRTIYTGPETFTVDVQSGQENDIAIDIRRDAGWKATDGN